VIYLDNAATTIVYKEVVLQIAKTLEECYGNPSSLHSLGLKAENIISDAREEIANTLGAKKDEIYFSPSGTIANNTAILGYLKRNKRAGNKIFCSSVEHPSVYNVFMELKKAGYEVLEVPIIDYDLDYEFLEKNADDKTALISVMNVNNETGAIFDIKKIKNIVTKKNLKTVIHSDCIQSYMKLPINVREFGADLITFSAHKIGGAKGIGGLYVSSKINIEPIYYGGGQEKTLFSGTENVANIAGFLKAVKINKKENIMRKIAELSKIFLEKLDNEIVVNRKNENSISSIINISFNQRSEIVLHLLESMGVIVSSGSACYQKKGERNRVLKGFCVSNENQDRAIRISIGHHNTMDEILFCSEKINELYRKFII
jgi:cysteine desulfurase